MTLAGVCSYRGPHLVSEVDGTRGTRPRHRHDRPVARRASTPGSPSSSRTTASSSSWGCPSSPSRARSLFVLAAMWCVVSPVVSHLVRLHLADVGPLVPTTADLAHPGGASAHPAHLHQLLPRGALGDLPPRRNGPGRLGDAPGRSSPSGSRSAGRPWPWLAQLGSAPRPRHATGACVRSPPHRPLHGEHVGGGPRVHPGAQLVRDHSRGLPLVARHRRSPTPPHRSTSPTRPARHTSSSASSCSSPGGSPRAWAVALGAGAMTLTLYSAHVVMLQPDVWPADGPDQFNRTQVLLVLAVGAVFAVARVRGPLRARGPARLSLGAPLGTPPGRGGLTGGADSHRP